MPIFWDPFGGNIGSGAPTPTPLVPPTQPPSGDKLWAWCHQTVSPDGVLGLGCCYTTTNQPPGEGYSYAAGPATLAELESGGFLGIQPCSGAPSGGPSESCYQAPDGSIVTLSSEAQPPVGYKPVPCPTPPAPGGQPQPAQACAPQVCPNPNMMDPGQFGGGGDFVVAGEPGTDCEAFDQWAANVAADSLLDSLKKADWVDSTNRLTILDPVYQRALAIPTAGPFIAAIVDGFSVVVMAPLISVSQFLSAFWTNQGCNGGAMVFLAWRKILLTWVRRIFGLDTAKIDQILSRSEDYLCPTGIAGVPDANLARMRGEIEIDQWRCWVRMADMNEDDAQILFDASREMLPPFEYGRAWLRGYIDDNYFDEALKTRGMLDDIDRELAKKLTEFYPPVTDILHFIVRSLGDPQTVQRFGLLEEFDILYQGKLVEWGEAAGIKKETMEFYHAAHWVVPPIGMIFTMRQRLREENLPEGTDAGDWIVDDEDVNRALRENAYAPFWRPRLEAIAYNPISRRDLLQAYQRGILDEEHFASRLRDLGYDQPNANLIAETYKARILDAIKKEQWTKLYADSAVTHAQAVAQLESQGYSLELIETALAETDQLADAKTRIDCLKNFEREYALGGLSSGDAASLLLQAGLDNTQTQRLLVQWDCRKRSRPKSVPAATLCKWYSRGLISPEEIAIRLVRVGYSEDDARLIVAECVASTADQRLRARYKALQEQQRELQRQQRTGAYVSKQQALAKAAEIKALAKQLKARESVLIAQEREQTRQAAADARTAERQASSIRKAETSEERKEAKLQVAAQALSVRAGIDSEAAASLLATALSTAIAQPGIDPDTALEAIILSAHDRRSVDETSFQALVQKAIQAALTIESGAIAAVPQPAPSSPPAPKTP